MNLSSSLETIARTDATMTLASLVDPDVFRKVIQRKLDQWADPDQRTPLKDNLDCAAVTLTPDDRQALRLAVEVLVAPIIRSGAARSFTWRTRHATASLSVDHNGGTTWSLKATMSREDRLALAARLFLDPPSPGHRDILARWLVDHLAPVQGGRVDIVAGDYRISVGPRTLLGRSLTVEFGEMPDGSPVAWSTTNVLS